jgi:hypothetical protein
MIWGIAYNEMVLKCLYPTTDTANWPGGLVEEYAILSTGDEYTMLPSRILDGLILDGFAKEYDTIHKNHNPTITTKFNPYPENKTIYEVPISFRLPNLVTKTFTALCVEQIDDNPHIHIGMELISQFKSLTIEGIEKKFKIEF